MNAISAYSYSFENSQYRPICDWLWQDSFLSLHIFTSSSFHHLIAQVWCLSQWGLRDDIFKAFVLQFMNLSASPLLCFLWKSKASSPSVGDEPTNQIAGFEIVLITDFILRLHVIPEAPLEFTFLAHWRVLLLLRNGTQPFMSVFVCFLCLRRASAPRGAITSLCWRRCVLPGSPWSSCCASFRRRASACSCVRL